MSGSTFAVQTSGRSRIRIMSSSGEEETTLPRESRGRKSRRHDSDSESESAGRSEKKAAKRAKKEQKKERKAKKAAKQSSDKEKDHEMKQNRDEDVLSKVEPILKTEEIKAFVAPLSHVDFFASLTALENLKPSVGTVHTVGKKPDAEKKTGRWDCPKCSTSNMNNAHQCHKCKAIKRMTEYR